MKNGKSAPGVARNGSRALAQPKDARTRPTPPRL